MRDYTVTLSLTRFKELEHKESVLNKIKRDSSKIIVQISEPFSWIDVKRTLFLSTESKEIDILSDQIKSKSKYWEDKYNSISQRSLIKRIFNYG